MHAVAISCRPRAPQRRVLPRPLPRQRDVGLGERLPLRRPLPARLAERAPRLRAQGAVVGRAAGLDTEQHERRESSSLCSGLVGRVRLHPAARPRPCSGWMGRHMAPLHTVGSSCSIMQHLFSCCAWTAPLLSGHCQCPGQRAAPADAYALCRLGVPAFCNRSMPMRSSREVCDGLEAPTCRACVCGRL